MKEFELGDAPIQEDYREMMRDIARAIDRFLNEEGEKKIGFIMLMFPFGDAPDQRCNYISNAYRSDVVRLLREQLHRFEEDARGHQ
jgi:hypothetical protein